MSIFRIAIVILFSIISSAAFCADYEYNFGSPLIDAADTGNEYLVVSYLTKGNAVNTRGTFGTTALMRASIRGHSTVVRRLLEAGADVNAKDVGGATALHLAARTGSTEIVELLLKRGADPDASDMDGYTPLQRAAQTQYVAVIDAMIKSGNATVNKRNKEGLSAMDIAHKSSNQKVIEAMTKPTEQHTSSQILKIPEGPVTPVAQEVVAPAPVEEIKVEEVKPIEENDAPQQITAHENNLMQDAPKPTEVKKDKDLVKDLRSLIAKKKSEAVVPHYPTEVAVKEVEPVVEEPKVEEKPKVQVSVAEAIKVPDEVDLRDSAQKLRIKKDNSVEHNFAPTQSTTAAEVSQAIRSVSMEVSSFETEDEGVAFWDKIIQLEPFKGKNAELVEDKADVISKYTLRLGGFTKSTEVFESCKIVKKKNPNVLCYVVHDVY